MAGALSPFGFAVVSALPSASSAPNTVLVQGGKLWFSNGTTWVDLGLAGGAAGPNAKILSILDSAAAAFNNNPRNRGVIGAGAPLITVGTGSAPAGHTRTFTFGATDAPFVSSGGRPTTASGRTTFPVVTPSSTRIDFAWRVETIVDAESVAFLLDSVTTNGYRFIVDGQYVSMATTTSAAGSQRYYRLQWPTKGKRRVIVEGTRDLGFWGAAVPDDGGCFLPSDGDGLRLFVVGDSDLFMQDFEPKGDAYGFVLGDFLGMRDTWCNGISATGFTVSGGGNSYGGRRADWTTLAADSVDVLAIQMSYNDMTAGPSDAVLKAAIATEIAQARAAHPNAIIVLFGCASWDDASTAAPLAADELLAIEAITEANDPLVGFIPVYAVSTASYRPTYGDSAAGDTGTGNTSRYVSNASGHMNIAGNAHYGEWLARRFIALLASMAGVPVPALAPPDPSGANGKRSRERFWASTDCVSTTADQNYTYAVSGTGAAFSMLGPATNNAVGIVRAALGTTATGRCAVASLNFNLFRFGLGRANFDALWRLVNLSDATNAYSQRAGFIDSVSAESADGVFFRYTHGTNSGRFQAVCRSNSSETAVDTGVTAAVSTWYRTEIIVNPAGSLAEFFLNGSRVAAITTNIPNASGRETGYGVMALRSAGTAAFNCYDADYVDVTYDFTTPR